jgi:putative phage-type endonuclease
VPAIKDRIVLCDQGTADWFQARLLCVTSSRVAAATAKRKRVKAGEVAEELACRRSLKCEMLVEHLTGRAPEHYVSEWMEQGREKEPMAREEYTLLTGNQVEQVGFVYHPTIKLAGASPDGLVGDDGIIEIKCPKIETHIQYLLNDQIPEEYKPQLLWQLACEDTRLWIDFVSYHPDMPEPYNIFVKRMERTKEAQQIISGMELEAVQFLLEVDDLVERLKSRRADSVPLSAG